MEEQSTQITTPAGGAGLLPLPLAMAYVPPQRWTIVYQPELALRAGTLFPALDLPFEGVRK